MSSVKATFRFCCFLGIVLLSASCGYQFQGSGSTLPEEIKTVAILPVQNNTTTSGIGLQFLEALRLRFDRYGVVTVVDNPDEADAFLETKIISIENKVQSVTGETDIELEALLILTVSAELKTRQGQLLYSNPAMAISEPYASVSDTVVTSSAAFAQSGIGADSLSGLGAREVSRGQQDQAINEVIEEAARKLYLEAVAADF